MLEQLLCLGGLVVRERRGRAATSCRDSRLGQSHSGAGSMGIVLDLGLIFGGKDNHDKGQDRDEDMDTVDNGDDGGGEIRKQTKTGSCTGLNNGNSDKADRRSGRKLGLTTP